MDEVILCESRTLREEYCTEKNTDILHRIGKMAELPGTAWTTIDNIADFYMVGVETIKSVIKRHRDELKEDGYQLLNKKDFAKFAINSFDVSNRGIGIFPRRAVLRIGMILRDSPVAQQLRSYLLNLEQAINNEQSLMTMASQLTQHSMQISRNVQELGELAQASIDQSRMIRAIITEIYKNKDDIQEVKNTIKDHNFKVTSLDDRVTTIEKSFITPKPQIKDYISSKQIQELREKAKSKKEKTTKIWINLRKHFKIKSYVHLPQEKFSEAMLWIDQNFK